MFLFYVVLVLLLVTLLLTFFSFLWFRFNLTGQRKLCILKTVYLPKRKWEITDE